LTSSKIAEQNVELFERLETMPNAMQLLDAFLNERNHEWYKTMGIDEESLKNDLYKVHHYAWGGDQNNSLDKHLISRYVKVISNYDELQSKQNEIADNAWNYVQTSWYNNWTSYLIESFPIGFIIIFLFFWLTAYCIADIIKKVVRSHREQKS
jgi:hypothetical protein